MRASPYIWATWLTKLLVGSDQCEWSSWFKAHHQAYDKAPSDFDLVKWQMQHTDLLNRTRDQLEESGHKVFTEKQNSFSLKGKTGITLGGKPDLIAIKDSEGLIVDAKTGQPKDSDAVQVMIYMWAIPLALPRFKNVPFEGLIVYETYQVKVPSRAIDRSFQKRLGDLIKRIGGDEPCRKIPSGMECQFCQIAASECPERILEMPSGGNSGVTDEF